jgi:hypothetical protein
MGPEVVLRLVQIRRAIAIHGWYKDIMARMNPVQTFSSRHAPSQRLNLSVLSLCRTERTAEDQCLLPNAPLRYLSYYVISTCTIWSQNSTPCGPLAREVR